MSETKMLKSSSLKSGLAASLMLNFVSKGLVFVVNLIIASSFGSSLSTDIYFYSSTLIVFVVSFFSGITTAVIIPESIRLEVAQKDNQYQLFINGALYVGLGFMLVVCMAVALNPTPVFFLISNFDMRSLEESTPLLLWSILVLILQLCSTYLTDILVSRRRLILPMVISLVNSCLIIAFVRLTGDDLGIKSIFIANVIAYMFSCAMQIVLLKFYLNWSFQFSIISFQGTIFRNVGFVALGWTATILASFAPLYLLSGFENGIVTSFALAQRIADVPTAIFSTHFANAVGIKFNELGALRLHGQIDGTFLKASKILLIVLIPASILIALFSEFFASFLFQHGAMQKEATTHVGEFLRYFILAAPFYGLNLLASKVLIAYQRIKISFVYQVAANTIFLVFILLLIKGAGAIGYGYAYVLFYFINSLLLFVQFKMADITMPSITKVIFTELTLVIIFGVTALAYYLNSNEKSIILSDVLLSVSFFFILTVCLFRFLLKDVFFSLTRFVSSLWPGSN